MMWVTVTSTMLRILRTLTMCCLSWTMKYQQVHAVVEYTMSTSKKGGNWHLNTNIQFVIVHSQEIQWGPVIYLLTTSLPSFFKENLHLLVSKFASIVLHSMWFNRDVLSENCPHSNSATHEWLKRSSPYYPYIAVFTSHLHSILLPYSDSKVELRVLAVRLLKTSNSIYWHLANFC